MVISAFLINTSSLYRLTVLNSLLKQINPFDSYITTHARRGQHNYFYFFFIRFKIRAFFSYALR